MRDLLAIFKPRLHQSFEIPSFVAPEQTKTFPLSRGPLDQFMYPDETSLDDWGKLEVRKLRKEIESRYTRYNSFDICCLREFLSDMGIPMTPETKDSLDKLRKVHCVNFSMVPPAIFERIPHWFNHVVSCGTVKHPLIQEQLVIDV